MRVRKLLLTSALLLAATQTGNAVFTADNCYTNSQYGSSSHFNAQHFDANCAAAGGGSGKTLGDGRLKIDYEIKVD